MVNYNTNIRRNTHNSLECKGFELVSQGVLGSKNLGFYVFRTLMCIVDKSGSKQYV